MPVSPAPVFVALAASLVGIVVVALLAVWRAHSTPPLPPPLEGALAELLAGVPADELRQLLPRYRDTSVWVVRARGEVARLEAGEYCRGVLAREIRERTEIRVGGEPGPPWGHAGDDPLFAFLQRVRAFEKRLESQFADIEALARALEQHAGARTFVGRLTVTFTLLILILVLCMMLVAYYGRSAQVWGVGP
jgi:hypothetical protein